MIDLRNGQVVHARGGERAHYRPLSSPLCDSSRPLDVVHALLARSRFASLYIADLDAIEGRGDHIDQINAIAINHPRLNLWVDSGLRNLADFESFRNRGVGVPVFGTESLHDLRVMELDPDRWILSLDFMDQRLVGMPDVWAMPDHWPRRTIVMSLAAVGSLAGPNVNLLRRVLRLAPATSVFAAGGVRDQADLDALTRLGARGALVGSAVYEGRLPTAD